MPHFIITSNIAPLMDIQFFILLTLYTSNTFSTYGGTIMQKQNAQLSEKDVKYHQLQTLRSPRVKRIFRRTIPQNDQTKLI